MPDESNRSGDGPIRRLLRGNVLWLSIVSLLNDAASEMIYPLLPLFLTVTLGAGPAFLGLIEGIAESASSILKLASGWFSDRFQRRKPLVVAGYTLACALRPLIAIVTLPWHVLAVRFADRVGKGIRSAPRDALLTESVAPGVRGRAFGIHRAADHAGAVIGPLIASLLLVVFHDSLRPVFALALVPGVLVVIVLVLKVREGDVVAPSSSAEGERAAEVGAPSPVDADSRRTFLRYLVVLAIFTLGNATDAFLLLRASTLGIGEPLIPLLWGVHHLSKMAWSVPGGSLADRFGPRRAIIAGWFVYALTYAGFAYASTATHIWLLFIVYGLFYGLTEAPEKALVAKLAPVGRRGSAFGAYHATIGIAALPSSILFGLIWQRAGAHAAFMVGAGLALAAAILLPLLVRERHAK
jgi:MFS family permease